MNVLLDPLPRKKRLYEFQLTMLQLQFPELAEFVLVTSLEIMCLHVAVEWFTLRGWGNKNVKYSTVDESLIRALLEIMPRERAIMWFRQKKPVDQIKKTLKQKQKRRQKNKKRSSFIIQNKKYDSLIIRNRRNSRPRSFSVESLAWSKNRIVPREKKPIKFTNKAEIILSI